MTAAASNPCNSPTLTVASDRSAKRDLLLIAAERYAEASADGFGGVELRALGEAARAWVKSMKPARPRVTSADGKPAGNIKREIRQWYGRWEKNGEPFRQGQALYLPVRCACGVKRNKRLHDLEIGGHDQGCLACHTAKAYGHIGHAAMKGGRQ